MKTITETFFTGLFPETIYEQTKEDIVFDALVFHDTEFLNDLLGTYLKRKGKPSPFKAKDFSVDHAIDDDLGITLIRIRIHNTTYSNIRKCYVVFRIVDKAAVERICYITEGKEDGSVSCKRINPDGSCELIETDIFEDYEEEEAIISDYLDF